MISFIKNKIFKNKVVLVTVSSAILLIIFLNSLIGLYVQREAIFGKVETILGIDHHGHSFYFENPKIKNLDRQIPPKNIIDLKVEKDSDIHGLWSAPIDWNVTAIHSVLLPDETVMTFGTYGIEKKEEKDIRADKKITLTDGTEILRDGGFNQWEGLIINTGIDFDIWDPKKGVHDDSHFLIKKQMVMDTFCSIVRVIDKNKIFILGGNINRQKKTPDMQKASILYDVEKKKFESSQYLNYPRWYGSVVITADEKMFMFGGEDTATFELSTIPEFIDLKNLDKGWQILNQSESNDLFGDVDHNQEWFYPKAFLASDGNIVGISYNKTWVMDFNNNYNVFKTGEIPLVKSGLPDEFFQSKYSHAKHSHMKNKSDEKHEVENIKLLTIGSPVGPKSSAVMIEKDKVLVFGGKQTGKQYAPSNKVYLIDFSNSFKPKIKELNSLNFARANGNATLLPDGTIFVNGGSSYNESYSVFTPEIYNPKNQTVKKMSEGRFRRNYHATSLLLPDGRILVAGGDVWNAEIFYPPYLFTKDYENKTVLAKRPVIKKLDKNIKRGSVVNLKVEGNVSKISLISTGSVTHANGSESKFRDIEFSNISKDNFEFKIDPNPNNIQNGTYLLFVLNSKGVPSEGKLVFVN